MQSAFANKLKAEFRAGLQESRAGASGYLAHYLKCAEEETIKSSTYRSD
jgi:hypothetical protein